MLTAEHQSDDYLIAVVQHVASGLRARFTMPKSRRGVGGVFSRPYSIASIDPDPNQIDARGWEWQRHAGLGIGTRIYLHGAQQFPGVRWSASVTNEASEGVRRKLHLVDPWRWAVTCEWCTAHDIDWLSAEPRTFAQHQRPPTSRAIVPS